MVETLKIQVEKTPRSRISEVDFANLPFGKVFTDHMFIADYRNGEWRNSRIVPYGYIPMSPATPAIHYGQAIFEGQKAYRGEGNEILVFRPYDNWKRLNISAHRMCMPELPEEIFMEGLNTLLDLDRAWVPSTEGSSLYLRPFMFSSEEFIGIRPGQSFSYMVIMSPVGPYYSTPVKVRIETHYTRAMEGGTGYAKAGGNYGGSLYPAKLAQDAGYHQLLWTDGKTHQYVEESGTMNVMFVIDDKVVTPELGDTILSGITRDSVLTLARHWGIAVEERKVSVKEVVDGIVSGRVTDAFGAGTAATIAPIELIGFDGKDYRLPPTETRIFSKKVLKALDDIKRGKAPDIFGWIQKV
jgi:branched-chain amino acid aminotransferase